MAEKEPKNDEPEKKEDSVPENKPELKKDIPKDVLWAADLYANAEMHMAQSNEDPQEIYKKARKNYLEKQGYEE